VKNTSPSLLTMVAPSMFTCDLSSAFITDLPWRRPPGRSRLDLYVVHALRFDFGLDLDAWRVARRGADDRDFLAFGRVDLQRVPLPMSTARRMTGCRCMSVVLVMIRS